MQTFYSTMIWSHLSGTSWCSFPFSIEEPLTPSCPLPPPSPRSWSPRGLLQLPPASLPLARSYRVCTAPRPLSSWRMGLTPTGLTCETLCRCRSVMQRPLVGGCVSLLAEEQCPEQMPPPQRLTLLSPNFVLKTSSNVSSGKTSQTLSDSCCHSTLFVLLV